MKTGHGTEIQGNSADNQVFLVYFLITGVLRELTPSKSKGDFSEQ